MGRYKDITGEVFHRLTAIRPLSKTKSGHMVWEFLCACGDVTQATSGKVISGNTKSCGCLRRDYMRETKTLHGKSKSGAFKSWSAMKRRCENCNVHNYGDYGGRGISYAPEWNEFTNFYEDMGDRPEGATLDRIDVNKDYSKENCRWASWQTQALNRRLNKDGTSSSYRGVHLQNGGKAYSATVRSQGTRIRLGRSKSELLMALRYDAAMSLQGLGEFTNKKSGLVTEELREKYPCDFQFWVKHAPKITQPIKFINEEV